MKTTRTNKAQTLRNNTLAAIAKIEGILGHEYQGMLFAEIRRAYLNGQDLAVALRWFYKADGADIDGNAGALLSLAFGAARDAFKADFAVNAA